MDNHEQYGLDGKLKMGLHEHIEAILIERIAEAEKALEDIIQSRDSESKSSAGDKYETGRSMMQLAQQQQETQLMASRNLLQHLHTLKNDKSATSVTVGSLVRTNHGIFYIAIGFGEVRFQEQRFYVLSMASPIAQLLKDKKPGANISFRDKTYEVLQIL